MKFLPNPLRVSRGPESGQPGVYSITACKLAKLFNLAEIDPSDNCVDAQMRNMLLAEERDPFEDPFIGS